MAAVLKPQAAPQAYLAIGHSFVAENKFPNAAADQNFARIALRLAFSVLDGLALNRIIDVSTGELEMVLEAFNAIAAPYFPHAPGGSS